VNKGKKKGRGLRPGAREYSLSRDKEPLAPTEGQRLLLLV